MRLVEGIGCEMVAYSDNRQARDAVGYVVRAQSDEHVRGQGFVLAEVEGCCDWWVVQVGVGTVLGLLVVRSRNHRWS